MFHMMLFVLSFAVSGEAKHSSGNVTHQNANGSGNVLVNGNSNDITNNAQVSNAHNTTQPNADSATIKQDLDTGNYKEIVFTDKKKEAGGSSCKKKLLILTATNFETKIIHQEAEKFGLKPHKEFFHDNVVYRLGILGGVEVFHMQPGTMGMLEPGCTPLILMSAFPAIDPDYVIATGIAFGRQSKGHVLGDVLVSKQLVNYESRKESDGKIYFRGDKVTSPMLQKVNAGIHSWKGAKIHVGLVASGNVLVNSKEFLERLSQREPEYVGGDMESYGVYAVASMMNAQWIMIKGISDWGDGTKNDDSHEIALQNAGAFIFHFIKEGSLK